MQRRSLLAATALSLGATGPGCAAFGGRPDVRLNAGRGTLHRADDLYVANGLRARGRSRVFATVAPDAAPDLVGPDAEPTIADPLREEAEATSSTRSSRSARPRTRR